MVSIWRPNSGTLLNLVAIFNSLAGSIESNLNTAIKDNGKSVFANTTARDAFYTAPKDGDMAVVGTTWPLIQMYYLSAWHNIGPSEYGARIAKTTTQSIATSAGGASVTAWDAMAEQRGGFTLDATDGLVVPFTGVYAVNAGFVMAAQASATPSQRDVRLLRNGGAVPGNYVQRIGATNGTGTTTLVVSVARILCDANDKINLQVVQVSGGALNLTSANLSCQFLGS